MLKMGAFNAFFFFMFLLNLGFHEMSRFDLILKYRTLALVIFFKIIMLEISGFKITNK